MKFAKNETLALYMTELGLDTGYVKIPIDIWRNIYIKHTTRDVMRKYYMGKK